MKTYQAQYRNLLEDTVADGHMMINKRTGKGILVYPHPVMITAELSHGLPIIDCRRTYPHTAMAEAVWMLMGTDDASWINSHCSLWKAFTHDGKVPNAYGKRIRHSFGRDQLAQALLALQGDTSDRRQYVSYWDPAQDGQPGQLNTPCPLGFTLSPVGLNRLNMMVPVRSSDLVLGLPTDMMTHAFLLAGIAKHLGMIPGTLALALSHPHIYTDHVPQVNEMLLDRVKLKPFRFLPSMVYMQTWGNLAVAEVKKHDTCPHPTVRKFDVAV